jgi:hypothetical protein
MISFRLIPIASDTDTAIILLAPQAWAGKTRDKNTKQKIDEFIAATSPCV